MEFAFSESTEGEFGRFVFCAGKISIAFEVRSKQCKTKSGREIWRSFVGKVMSLLLNMLSRLVITFLPRSKIF